jgi:hypothetical protein
MHNKRVQPIKNATTQQLSHVDDQPPDRRALQTCPRMRVDSSLAHLSEPAETLVAVRAKRVTPTLLYRLVCSPVPHRFGLQIRRQSPRVSQHPTELVSTWFDRPRLVATAYVLH